MVKRWFKQLIFTFWTSIILFQSLPLLNIESTVNKYWKNGEIVLVCKAYIDYTLNPISGTDQDVHVFTTDLINTYELIPRNDSDPGTYFKGGDRVYQCLRDNVFPTDQKFQKALR